MHVAIGGRFVVQNVTKTSVTYTGILLRIPSNNLFTCFFLVEIVNNLFYLYVLVNVPAWLQ